MPDDNRVNPEDGFAEIEALQAAAEEQMVDLGMGTAASVLLSLRGEGWELTRIPLSAVSELVERVQAVLDTPGSGGLGAARWCCGGPHTSFEGNPHGHAASCPMKPVHAALSRFPVPDEKEESDEQD